MTVQRRERWKGPTPIGDMSDPRGLARRAMDYFEWMMERHYSPATINSREFHLKTFHKWAQERGITRPDEVTKPILERYQRYLYHYRKQSGQPLSTTSQYSRLGAVRSFFSWMARENFILYNPASDLTMPRKEHKLPRHVLTAEEVERTLQAIDVTDPFGVRDRALIELLYSTGMRRRELSGLSLYDIDRARGTVLIRLGKGNRDRVVPIGERAVAWVDKYIDEVRGSLVVEPDRGHIFLNQHGDSLSSSHISTLVGKRLKDGGVVKRGSAHLFRHTMATLMLENGADIRFIQAMLGHRHLETTEIYTHVSIRKLKQIHEATHPAKLVRERVAEVSELAATLAAEDES